MREAYLTGKDLYSTMAAEIYKTTYENCREFYPDGTTNEEGKKEEVRPKVYSYGILYGRGTASVAEQIHSTVEEAQKIIDDFFDAYPAIKQFTEITQQKAKQNGYTTTLRGEGVGT